MAEKKILWSSEKLLSLAAMTISFITLVIFIYQTDLMRRQNYLSILPYVVVSTTQDRAGGRFEINLINHGVGPAILESVNFSYKGRNSGLEDYGNNMYRFLASLEPELDSLREFSYADLQPGVAIPVNAASTILSTHGSPADFSLLTNTINRLLADGLYYEIIYRSIQDEPWMLNNNTHGPKKLE